jgi:signal transduction histidine kinase
VHVRTLSALIDDLFELSRLEAGDIAWSLQQVRVDDLIAETVEAMRPHADAGMIQLHAELAPTLALANPEQIQRVLLNLLQNAIRHTPPDGSVVIRAQPGSRAVEIEVADTGDGIPSPHRARGFEPFAGDGGSAGLGLAIARAIVEAHGGEIWLEEAFVGTRVRFSLPVA